MNYLLVLMTQLDALQSQHAMLQTQINHVRDQIVVEILKLRTDGYNEALFKKYMKYCTDVDVDTIVFTMYTDDVSLSLASNKDFDEGVVVNFYKDKYDIIVEDTATTTDSTYYIYALKLKT
jgi:hypothetical protein